MIPVVAIDGPAASGKSSAAAEVARRLGWVHMDSGALYRAVTLVALDLGGHAAGAGAIVRGAERRGVDVVLQGDQAVVLVDNRPAEDRIRSAAVTGEVSPVSALPEVREWVNRRLRTLAKAGRPIVMDGRDIGTAVFPEAPVKAYLTAAPAVRASRRLLQRGEMADPQAVTAEAERIRARDRADAGRAVAPLRPAPDAVQLDTSDLSFEEVVREILGLVRSSPLPGPRGGR